MISADEKKKYVSKVSVIRKYHNHKLQTTPGSLHSLNRDLVDAFSVQLFTCWESLLLLSYADFFLSKSAFLKSFMNAIGPGLGPYYLHRLPADDKSCR